MASQPLPEVPTMKDHNWLEEAHQNAAKAVDEEVDKIRRLIQEEKQEDILEQQGGRGMLGGPPVRISQRIRQRRAGAALSKDARDAMLQFIGDYDPQYPFYLALFKITWDSLDQFMQYAKRYMARQDWRKFYARSEEELAKLGLV